MRGWLIEELEGRPEGYVQDGKLVEIARRCLGLGIVRV